jgi:hypothetical protein
VGAPYEWDTESERTAYEQAVDSCLYEDRLKELLRRRRDLTREAVTEAMSSHEHVSRMLGARSQAVRARQTRHLWFRLSALLWSAYREWLPHVPRLQRRRGYDTADGIRGLLLFGALSGLAFWLGTPPWSYVFGAILAVPVAVVTLAIAGVAVSTLRDTGFSESPGRQMYARAVGVLLAPVTLALLTALAATRTLWTRELRANGLVAEAAYTIEELLGGDRGTLLFTEGHDGLRSAHDDEYVVNSGPAVDLQRKMAQLDSGTIAVSGPRGVGKTTLLRTCVTLRDFAVLAQAPATYTPHDFLTSLFVQVCQQYISKEGYAAPEFVRLPHLQRTLRRLQPALRRLGYTLPAAALVGLGLYATERALQDRYGPRLLDRLSQHADTLLDRSGDIAAGAAPGTALALTFTGLFVWALRTSRSASWLLKNGSRAVLWLVSVCLIGGAFASLAFDPGILRHATALLTPWFLALTGVWLLCRHQYERTWEGPLRIGAQSVNRRLFRMPVYALPFLAVALLAWDDSTRPLITDDENPLRLSAGILGGLVHSARTGSWRLLRAEPRLVSVCRNHLYRLQTVQSTTAALTTGATQLLTLGTSHTSSLTTIPPNYPALVAEFRSVLTQVAEERHGRDTSGRVIIAIDEVDRLGTAAQALAFLGEIKAILGVPHVHYLISVAEDVGAAFVRRGLPHRDVTDSSLDDVLHVRACTLYESTQILEARAPGIGEPYAVLAHALSGGIPRDLIRYGRRLMEIKSSTSHVELAEIAWQLIVEELTETLAGFRTLLSRQPWHEENHSVLLSFRDLTGRLRTACPCAEPDAQLRAALHHFAAHDAGAPTDEARQLIDEATAYAYFSLTLLDVFGHPEFTRRRRAAAAGSPEGEPWVLAEARLELGVSPYSARALVDGIRRAWTVGDPGTAVIPAPRVSRCARHTRR